MKLIRGSVPWSHLLLLGAAAPVSALDFNFTVDAGTPSHAIAGFQAAADRWSGIFADPITINLTVGYEALSLSILGTASANFFEVPYSTLRNSLIADATSPVDTSATASLLPGLSYSRIINRVTDNPNSDPAIPFLTAMDRVGITFANAKAIGIAPAAGQDATIRFNSLFTWDFDPNDGIAPGAYDFVGAATHEIGHALGYVSGVDDIDSFGGLLESGDFSSNVLDLFRYSAASVGNGPSVTDYAADPRNKYFSIDGGATLLTQFATGVNFGDGKQASHWKDNLGLGILDPTGSPGELLTISANDIRALDAIGYTLVPEPTGVAAAGLMLLSAGALVLRRTRVKTVGGISGLSDRGVGGSKELGAPARAQPS